MGRSSRRAASAARMHSASRRLAKAGAPGLISVSLLGIAPAASATTTSLPSFTWTGSASAATGQRGWSVPGNWQGNAAPPPSSPVNLVFPVLSCGSTCGDATQNDQSGMLIHHLTMKLTGLTGPASGFGYSVSGNPVTVGGLTVKSAVTSGQSGQGAFVNLPLVLGAGQTWSVDVENGSNFDLAGVTGSGRSLTVSLPVASGNFGGFLDFMQPVNVGNLSFTNPSNGRTVVIPNGSMNGGTKRPVTFTGSALFSIGRFNPSTVAQSTTTFGPLTTTRTAIQLGNGGGTGPYGIVKVAGNAAFDSGSTLALFSLEPGAGASPQPGLDYPQLVATGTVSLGGMALGLVATACNQTVGTVYTIVKSGSGVSGTFAGVPNGTVIHGFLDSESSCQVAGATAPYLRITYKTKAVIATVVAPPATAAAMAQQPTSPGGAVAPTVVEERDGQLHTAG